MAGGSISDQATNLVLEFFGEYADGCECRDLLLAFDDWWQDSSVSVVEDLDDSDLISLADEAWSEHGRYMPKNSNLRRALVELAYLAFRSTVSQALYDVVHEMESDYASVDGVYGRRHHPFRGQTPSAVIDEADVYKSDGGHTAIVTFTYGGSEIWLDVTSHFADEIEAHPLLAMVESREDVGDG